MELSVKIYGLTKDFPREELCGMVSQLRRAGISIISNIAEGHGRDSRPQLAQFLSMARGSVFEVEAQLLLCQQLSLGDQVQINCCLKLCDEVRKILNSLLQGLKQPIPPSV
jgi:four helix bundle protein